MPLPAALAARLAKRGLVKPEEIKLPQKPEEVEEVFAEDYDDPSNPDTTSESTVKTTTNSIDTPTEHTLIYETVACPNKWNPYHKCVAFCRGHWGVKEFIPEPVMLKRRERHLRKYPLPEGWIEVADPETGRYYYWSVTTDQVSWLSPLHPQATITLPADRLQAMLDSSGRADIANNDDEHMEVQSDLSDLSSSESSSDGEQERRRDRNRDRGRRYSRGHNVEKKGSKRGKEDTLDPMDPASYSDIPRGSWSDGLDQRGKAKTGVDVTVSGPLFQQRPYPSPGDVLRANREMSEKKT